MSYSNCRFIKSVAEFVEHKNIKNIPNDTRGVYLLLRGQAEGRKGQYDVVYVGMTDWGMKTRLGKHRRAKRSKSHWTHFTIFEVHDNITREEIRELEGLIRHAYRADSHANRHNLQLRFKPFEKIKISSKRLQKKDWGK